GGIDTDRSARVERPRRKRSPRCRIASRRRTESLARRTRLENRRTDFSAQRHIKNIGTQEWACGVLAEAGRAEDAALIWDATHETPPRSKNWYEGPAL